MPQASHDGKPALGGASLQKTEEEAEAGGRDGSLPRNKVSGASLANFILGRPMAKKRTWVGGWIVVAMAGMCALGEPALAQPARPAGRQEQLVVEGARLRSELQRTNAEVSALKRSGPGVRNDYRLHRKQADAEELARKLTGVEAELRRLRGQTPAAAAPASVDAAEAPAALEARADLLSDEARRLAQQASGMVATAGELRSRRTLLRRGGQIERDPFASMDASKRFMVLQGTRATSAPGAESGRSGTPTPPPAPVPVSGPPTAVAPPQAGTFAGTSTPTAATDSRNSGGAPSRALLDPTSVAELRRTEQAAGKPVSEIERLERAAAALNDRARALEAEARLLRDRAAKR
jgi:hypothetical protein